MYIKFKKRFLDFRQLIFDKKILIKFVSGSLFTSITQIISNIIILKIITPNELGIWNSLMIIQTYALFFQAGVLNGLNRELPFYLGKKDINKANELAASALYFFIGGVLIFIGVCFVLGRYYFKDSSVEWMYTYIGIIVITGSKFYENYLTTTFRSNNSFEKLSYIYFVRGILQLISVGLIFYFYYEGYIFRMVLLSFVTVIMLHMIRPIKVKPKFSFKAIIHLTKVGLPIFALIFIYNTSLTFDRILFIKYSTTEVIGYYSLGLMALGAFKMLPESLASYLYPRLSFDLGEGKSTINLINKSIRANAIIFTIMFILSVIGCFLLPPVIREFFPKYIEGIVPAQILLFGGAFAGGSVGNNVITSLKAWKQLSIIFIGGSLLNVIIIYIASIYSSNLLIGISVGLFISSFLFMLLSNYILFAMRRNLNKIEDAIEG